MKSCTDTMYKFADMQNAWSIRVPYYTDADNRRRVGQRLNQFCLTPTFRLQQNQRKPCKAGVIHLYFMA